MVWRCVHVALVAVCFVAAGAGAADAKMPYFSLMIEPEHPVAGEPANITVRFWNDPAHTEPTSVPMTTIPRLVALRSIDQAAPEINPTLRWNGSSGAFEARVVFPVSGAWTVVAFPDRSGWSSTEVPAGYPDGLTVTVVSQDGSVGLPSGNPVVLASTGILVVAAIAATALAVLRLLGRGRDPRFA